MMESVKQNENNFRKSLFFIILIEFLCFIFSGISFQGLYHSVYFDLGIEPLSWLFFLFEIPQFIFRFHEVGVILDITVFLLLLYCIFIKENKFITWTLFILLMMFYVCLTAVLGHRNYQTGFFVMIIPFLFSNPINRKFAFEGIRYFFVFFYFSSGLFKIINQGILDPTLMSSNLKHQFIPYFIESNFNWRTNIIAFLVRHWFIAYVFYCITAILETSFLIGFFSKKLDFFLGIILFCFHVSNWIIMDIAPIGQFAVIFFFLRYKGNSY